MARIFEITELGVGTYGMGGTPLDPTKILAIKDDLNAEKDVLNGVSANNTATLNISTIAEMATTDRIGRTRLIIDDLDRGGLFKYVASGLTSNGGTIFDALGGGYWSRIYSGHVNVKWFGAKGDKVTDDYSAFQDAINFCKASVLSDASVKKKLYIPEGWFILGQTLIINKTVMIEGAGRFFTVLDSRTATGYLMEIDGSNSYNIGGFSMLFNSGGIKHLNTHKGVFNDIWSGIGSLSGPAIHNVGSMLCKYTRITITTNSEQITSDYSKMCDYGFLFEHSPTYPSNMSIIDKCIVEGVTLDGVRIVNNNPPLSNGQGYVKCSNSTIEGNKRYDFYLEGLFGAELSQCHAEGIAATYNVLIVNCHKLKFTGGLFGRMKVETNSYANTFDGCYFTSVEEDSTSIQNNYLNCAFDSNSVRTFNAYSNVVGTSLIGNYGSDALKTVISEKSHLLGDVLTSNGNFRKWSNATTPFEFYATGGAIIDREGGSGLRFDGVYSAKITAVGTTSHQGLSYAVTNSNSSTSDWITIGFWVRRPLGQNKDIKIIANIGYDVITVVPQEETIDDTYSFVSRSFKLSASSAYITICPADTMVGGEYIHVDNVTVKRGKGIPISYCNRTQENLNFGLDNTGFTTISRGTAAPTTGVYLVGDIVINSTSSSGSVHGWKCSVAGSPGTWLPLPKITSDNDKLESGTTALRPTSISTGFLYFDTTLGKPIWRNGSNWVDSTGTTV